MPSRGIPVSIPGATTLSRRSLRHRPGHRCPAIRAAKLRRPAGHDDDFAGDATRPPGYKTVLGKRDALRRVATQPAKLADPEEDLALM